MVKHTKSKDQSKNAGHTDNQINMNEMADKTKVSDESGSVSEAENSSTDDLKEKYNDLNDKYLRLYSEFDNYRKRVIKEKIDLSKTASEDVISGLLTILDDFERALQTLPEADDDPTKQGISLIYNKFKSILSQKGLNEIKSMDEKFDTDFHEAIANIPAPAEEFKNKIIDVTQKGYMLNGKVIRFAKVVVGI